MTLSLNGTGTITGIAQSLITSGTSQATTSGTSIDFTGIPSWVKRVTVMLAGVSTSGTSSLIVRIGDSTGFYTTGYQGANAAIVSTAASTGTSTVGLLIGGASASNQCIGSLVISSVGNNNWVANGVFYFSDTQVNYAASAKTISGTLDRVRLTTINGTDTFDAGSVNILYE